MGAGLGVQVVLCADAAEESGLGHLARVSALAAALEERGLNARCIGLGAQRPVEIDSATFEPEPSDVAAEQPVAIVLDSYRDHPEWEGVARGAAVVCRFWDQGPAPAADLIISSRPQESSSDHMLSGPEHACLRPAFWDEPEPPPAGPLESILVTSGGRGGVHPVEALAERVAAVAPEAEIVAIGRSEAGEAMRRSIRLVPPQPTLAPWYAAAHLVVCGAGQTMLEAAASRRPCLAAPLAENQLPQLAAMDGLGAVVAVDLNDRSLETEIRRYAENPAARLALADRARGTIDGGGARRLAAELANLIERGASETHATGTVNMRVREAVLGDSKSLLALRNDPETRRGSRSSKEVSAADHANWIEDVLADPNRYLLMVEADGGAIAQVRFDRIEGDNYEISVSLTPSTRGRGLASGVIEAGCRWLAGRVGPATINAFVKPDNEASTRAFVRAEFQATERAEAGLELLVRRPEGGELPVR